MLQNGLQYTYWICFHSPSERVCVCYLQYIANQSEKQDYVYTCHFYLPTRHAPEYIGHLPTIGYNGQCSSLSIKKMVQYDVYTSIECLAELHTLLSSSTLLALVSPHERFDPQHFLKQKFLFPWLLRYPMPPL